jgi:hypothetical protein
MPMSEQPKCHAIYLNGLNSGTISRFERNGLAYANNHGFSIEHLPVNWLAPEPFEDLLEWVAEKCKADIKQYDMLLLVGASAGGSLAVNVLGRVRNPNLYVVTLCSRLCDPKLPWWDIRNLHRMARLGMSRASERFYDSVKYCETVTLPGLSSEEKEQIITVKQWADEVVPRTTMNVADLKSYHVAGFGHHYGIFQGIRHLDRVVAKLVH